MLIRLTNPETGRKITKNLPTEWAEIKVKHRLEIAHLVFQGNRTAVLNAILVRVMKLSASVFFAISDTDKTALIAQLNNIYFLPSAEPIIPSFTHRQRFFKRLETYYLPKKDFDDGTALQFALGVELYQRYYKSASKNDLLKLIQVLALPKGAKVTEAYEKEDFPNPLENLDFVIAMTVLVYFEGLLKVVNDLGKKFGLWEDRNSENTEGGILSPAQVFGWRAIYRSLVDHDLDAYEKLCQRPFFEVFQILIERKMQGDFMLAQSKQGENADTERN
jgi:hypothetical protein